MRENAYQAKLIKRIRKELDGCVILKNDSSYLQGVPDLVIFHGDKWGMLEVKAAIDSPFQPNQAYWVSELNHMSFAAFIYPENEDEVIRDLQSALAPRRRARTTKR